MPKVTPQRIGKYATGILGLRPGDIWLPSFPKAGSTWVRFLLCNLISLSELGGREVDYHFLDATMPALGHSNLIKSWNFKTVPRFIKTHQTYRRFLFAVPRRTVYILRDPRDVMISYFHFQQAHAWYPFKGNFSDFIRHPHFGLRASVQHYFSWLPRISFILRYEALLEDTATQFQEMLATLQIPVRDELLKVAVERSSFKRVRETQKKSGLSGPQRFNPKFQVARKGKSNQWPDYFSDEDLALYQQICQEYEFELYP